MDMPRIGPGQVWRDNLQQRHIRVIGTRAGMVQVITLTRSGTPGKRIDIWCGAWLESYSNCADTENPSPRMVLEEEDDQTNRT